MKHFLIGAMGYPLLELAWRGHTHPSMALAGGLSASMIHQVGRTDLPFLNKVLLCGAGVTAVEGLCGFIWNRRHQVWDYRRIPLNWRGQVCLPYTVAWCGISAIYLFAERAIRQSSH
ncbi:MAG: hypothetical protein E7316_00170 [Clostridiales bacterium]|nr:hypothetical protein [Clostridiales bacterium]